MKRIILTIVTIGIFGSSAQSVYRKDFDSFWTTLKQDYAYWDTKRTSWEKVKINYENNFDTVSSHASFILLLEKVFNEIYDHHASLNANTSASQRLVPSGTDIWEEYVGGKPKPGLNN